MPSLVGGIITVSTSSAYGVSRGCLATVNAALFKGDKLIQPAAKSDILNQADKSAQKSANDYKPRQYLDNFFLPKALS